MEIFKNKTPQFDLDLDLSVPENRKKFENEIREWWTRVKRWRSGSYRDKDLEKQRLELLKDAEEIRKEILNLPKIYDQINVNNALGIWPFSSEEKKPVSDTRNKVVNWSGKEEQVKSNENQAFREGKIDRLLGIATDSDSYDKVRGILVVGGVVLGIYILGKMVKSK